MDGQKALVSSERKKAVVQTLLFGLILGAVVILPIWPYRDALAEMLARARLHAPDWALFARQELALKVHVAAALAAFAIGLVVLLCPKGTGFHRTLGWAWVVTLTVTAVCSFWITGLNGDFYSVIHLLSGWTLVALPMAIYAIRRGRVKQHRQGMVSLFIGGLVVAGAFAFIPGRFMFQFLFG